MRERDRRHRCLRINGARVSQNSFNRVVTKASTNVGEVRANLTAGFIHPVASEAAFFLEQQRSRTCAQGDRMSQRRSKFLILGRPVLRFDTACPLEEGDQVIEFPVRERKPRHFAPGRKLFGVADHCLDPGISPPPKDLRHIRAVVRTEPQYRMAAAALIFLPAALAGDHLLAQLVSMRQCPDLAVGVDSQDGKEYQRHEPAKIKRPTCSFPCHTRPPTGRFSWRVLK